MGKITQEMKDIAAKTMVYILATSDKEGKPNGVPIGFVNIKDDEVVLADNFMLKTRRNLEQNPVAAVSYWSGDARYGFQLKGKTRIETSGEYYDEMSGRMEERKLPFKPKAVVVLAVEEAYYIGAGKNTADNLI
jgi:predicted pyridoxine 5'-phosphate oxidase superfamily flavin-nucleotide-binding protein